MSLYVVYVGGKSFMKKLIASFIKGIGSIVVINPKIRNKKIKDIFNRSDSEALYSD